MIGQERVDPRQSAADEPVDRFAPELPPDAEGDDRAQQGGGQGESGPDPQAEQRPGRGGEQRFGAGDERQAGVEDEEQRRPPHPRCTDPRPQRLDVGGPEDDGQADRREQREDEHDRLHEGSSAHG